VQIGIMKRAGLSVSLMNAITAHISACLDNITPAVVDEIARRMLHEWKQVIRVTLLAEPAA
ncbi:hypothetical protein ACCT21_34650, partial [Rhizobium brockwellii]